MRNCILAPTSFTEITFTLTKEGCPSLGGMSRRTILEYILFYQKVESHKKSKYVRHKHSLPSFHPLYKESGQEKNRHIVDLVPTFK